jgi:hypothetical protein
MHKDDSSRPPRCSYEDARVAFLLPAAWDDARVSFAAPKAASLAGLTIAREHATEPLAKRVLAKLVQAAKNTKLVFRSCEDVEVAGRAARSMRFELPSEAGPVERSLVLVDTPTGGCGESLVVTTTALRDSRDQTSSVFAHVLASIQPASDDAPCAPRGDSMCRFGSFVFAPPHEWWPRVHAQALEAELEMLREPLTGGESLRTYADRKLLAIGGWRTMTFAGSSGENVGGRSAIAMRFHDETSEHTVVMVEPGDEAERNATVFYLGAPKKAAPALRAPLIEVLQSVRFDAAARSGRVTRSTPPPPPPEVTPRPTGPFIPMPGMSYR